MLRTRGQIGFGVWSAVWFFECEWQAVIFLICMTVILALTFRIKEIVSALERKANITQERMAE